MWPAVFILVFVPMQSWAVNLNDCTKIKDPEQNAMCMAQATVSINHCDKIKNLSLKEDCIHWVRKEQRRLVWNYNKK